MPKKQSSGKRKAAALRKGIAKRGRLTTEVEAFGAQITSAEEDKIDFDVIAKYDHGGMPYLTFAKAADKRAAVEKQLGETLTIDEFFKQSR